MTDKANNIRDWVTFAFTIGIVPVALLAWHDFRLQMDTQKAAVIERVSAAFESKEAYTVDQSTQNRQLDANTAAVKKMDEAFSSQAIILNSLTWQIKALTDAFNKQGGQQNK